MNHHPKTDSFKYYASLPVLAWPYRGLLEVLQLKYIKVVDLSTFNSDRTCLSPNIELIYKLMVNLLGFRTPKAF